MRQGRTFDWNNSISYAKIANNIIIQNNTSIGHTGFGFTSKDGKYKNIKQLGLVIIKNNVCIGANCTIDRGSMSNTIIETGTHIDSMIHIAHNVKIGKYCIIAAQTGIAGSTIIGDYVTFGGQTGVAGHLKINSHNIFAAQSGVTKNIQGSQETYYGMPATQKRIWQKIYSFYSRKWLWEKNINFWF